jgi:hypothetical protein
MTRLAFFNARPRSGLLQLCLGRWKDNPVFFNIQL